MKTSLLIYSIANTIGGILFFGVVAGICQQAKMEQRDYFDFGDSSNFILFAVPVFLLCLAVNTLWGVKAVIDIVRRRSYQTSVVFGFVLAVWTVLFLGFSLNPWAIFSLIPSLLPHHPT